ncbi:MAG: hypothetical protein RJA18_1492, partial [Pseudomonadota bacterium]
CINGQNHENDAITTLPIINGINSFEAMPQNRIGMCIHQGRHKTPFKELPGKLKMDS